MGLLNSLNTSHSVELGRISSSDTRRMFNPSSPYVKMLTVEFIGSLLGSLSTFIIRDINPISLTLTNRTVICICFSCLRPFVYLDTIERLVSTLSSDESVVTSLNS